MPLHPLTQTCSNCYYFVNGSTHPGACAFRAPDPSGSFPSVSHTAWCGKWRHGPPPSEDAQWARVLTNADGVATFTFPIAFEYNPVVTFSVESADDMPYMSTLSDVGPTSAAVRVWHGQLLPASVTPVTVLENYNVFDGSSLEDIPVHILALPVGV